MFRKILRWIDEQSDLVSITRHFLEEPLPQGVGWPHVFGSLALFAFSVQVMTGVFLLFYYTPTPDHAHETVDFITHQLPFGGLVRGLHHWCASAMALLVGLHMLQAYVWGAYKKPRQIIWVIGVFLLLVTMGLAFTGYLLPWDQKAYWAAVVGTNIAAAIPVVGSFIREVARGGDSVGALTLTRFFAIHTCILPSLLMGLIVFHLFQLRKKGITPPWRRVDNEADVEFTQRFFPDQLFKDMVAILGVLAMLYCVVIYYGAPLERVANPSETGYVPRPEWFFLYMFQLLKYFPGELEFVGAMVVPAVVVIAMLLLPYVDTNPHRLPRRRPFAMLLAAGMFAGMTTLGIMGLASTPRHKELSRQQKIGEKLFLDLRCSTCHGINGGGGNAGPDLAGAKMNDVKHLRTLLQNPQAFNPRSIMPQYDLRPDQMEALVTYLMSLDTTSQMPEAPEIGPKKPESHFQEGWLTGHKYEVRKDPTQCSSCHKPKFCQTCHQKRRPDSHLHQWIKAHFGTATEKPEYCAVCHERSYCTDCHKDVLHTQKWLSTHKQGVAKRPDICQECHTENFCIACHQGAEPESHVANWIHRHQKADTRTCVVCHKQDFCTSCHTGATPTSHNARWPKIHGRSAGPGCQQCHTKSFCSSCHQVPVPHPAKWRSALHQPAARQKPGSCANCHRQSFCLDCHSRRKPASHTAQWRKVHGDRVKSVGDTACANCHGEGSRISCTGCHGLPMPHPEDFALKHAKVASYNSDSLCSKCHTVKKFCTQCHDPEKFVQAGKSSSVRTRAARTVRSWHKRARA